MCFERVSLCKQTNIPHEPLFWCVFFFSRLYHDKWLARFRSRSVPPYDIKLQKETIGTSRTNLVNMNTTKNGRQTLSDHRTTVKRSPPIGFTGKAKSRKAHPPCGRTFPAPVEDEKDFSQKAHPPPTPAHLLCASHGVTGDVLRRAAGRVDLQKSAFLTQCCCFFFLCAASTLLMRVASTCFFVSKKALVFA